LAEKLGFLNVDELLEAMTFDQIIEWAAYLSIDPEDFNKQRLTPEQFQKMAAARYGSNR